MPSHSATPRSVPRTLYLVACIAAFCLVAAEAPAQRAAHTQAFRRGDTNADGKVDLSDGVRTLTFLFQGSTKLSCMDAADSNDSGRIDMADAVYTFSFLFISGPAPPAPGLSCGTDPTADELGCEAYASCVTKPVPGSPIPPIRLTGGGAVEVDGTSISEFTLNMNSGQSITIEATNISAGGDPVMHLLWEAPDADDVCEECEIEIINGKPHKICFDVSCSGAAWPVEGSEVSRSTSTGRPNPALSYTARASGKLRLVVRSRTTLAENATCDLSRNGAPWHAGVPFGGALVALDGLRTGEDFSTVRLPAGGGPTHAIYALGADGVALTRRFVGNGSSGGAICVPGVGSQLWLVGVLAPGMSGRMRVVRNDWRIAGHDSDGDGLGNELEAAIGTCAALGGFATVTIPAWRFDLLEQRAMERCDRATATTDEYDECYEEFMEFYEAYRTNTYDCSLAVDPRDTDGDGISDGSEFLGRSSQALPLWGADPRHKDMFVECDFMLRSPGEAPMKMSPSIARDFARYYQDDVGVATKLRLAYRAATVGNPDALPGIQIHIDTGLPPERPEDAGVYGDWGGYTAVPAVQQADGSWTGAEFTTAWKTHMSAARVGIFRYALPYSSGGGSNPYNSLAFSGGLNGDAYVLAHESGHAQGLGHSGPPNVPGLNCKPNYPSIMNYAYNNGTVGFSDGLAAPSLNNVSVKEFKAVPASNTAYLDTLERNFKYWVDRVNGHVDWNRDGVIAPEGTTVRAYANLLPNNSCEGTRANASTIPTAASIQSPAMARIGGRLYVFYSVLGLLKYTYSTSAWDCPVPDNTVCGTWRDSESPFMNAGGGVDVERVSSNIRAAQQQLLIVTIDNEGVLWESRLALLAFGAEAWTDPTVIRGSSPAAGEPSLARLGACDTMLVYKGVDGIIRYRKLTCSGWEPEKIATTPTGTQLKIWEHASPSVGRAFLPWRQGQAAIYGAFASETGSLGIYCFNASTGFWEPTNVLESTPSNRVEGRPAMAWMPFQDGAEFPGRFYLTFVNHDMDTSRAFRDMRRDVVMLMSYTKVTATPGGGFTKNEIVGLKTSFDNVWFYAFGIDLLFEQGIDTNLRSVSSIAINKPEVWATIEFRPKADGINSLNYVNYNDWETLRVGICRNVVNPDGMVANPIACP